MGWGFKVSGNGVTNTNYRKAPTKSSSVEIVSTEGSSSEENGNYSFTLAAKVDNTLAAGTYSGMMTFAATANEATYNISYQKGSVTNEGEVSEMPSGQDDEKTPNSTITISNADNPKHDKYVFMGWCEGEVTKDSENIEVCDGTTYQKGDKYTLKNDGQDIKLIAMGAKDAELAGVQ